MASVVEILPLPTTSIEDDFYNPEYREHAACKGLVPRDFFPERITKVNLPRIRTLLQTCEGCSVRVDCLFEAVKMDYDGIWGGMPEKERRAWVKHMRKEFGEVTYHHCVEFVTSTPTS